MNTPKRSLKIMIGITAYNEEKNITKLIQSILDQKEDGYSMAKIVLRVDGSTDKTYKEAMKIKSEKIEIVNDNKRMGQTFRINQLIEMIGDNDVLVLLDADIILQDTMTLKNLIEPFKKADVGMVNGVLIPVNTHKFIEKSILSTLDVYEKYIESVNGGNNIYAVKGAIMAISKDLATDVKIPNDVFANDTYLYLSCIKLSKKFIRVPLAKALYRIPSTINDQIIQNSRFASSENNLEKYFNGLLKSELIKNKVIFYKIAFIKLIQDPIHATAICAINLFSKLKSIRSIKTYNTRWEIASSTKT